MTEINLQLVADLARLAHKYPPEDWESVLSYIREPDRAAELIALLENVTVVSRRKRSSGGTAKASRGPTVQHQLNDLETSDPELARTLNEVWSKLRSRELLPEMTMIRSFAENAGLKNITASRREQAIRELMEHLLKLPAESLAAALGKAAAADRNLQSEYARWVALILHD